jgi:hypothetical protein
MLIIGAGGAGTQILLGTQLREVGHPEALLHGAKHKSVDRVLQSALRVQA